MLTDHAYTILSLLRPRVDNEDVRFAVRERYPIENAHQREVITADTFASTRCGSLHPAIIHSLPALFDKAKPGDPLRKILNPRLCS